MSTAIELLPLEKREVWEQQPDESALNFARFSAFMELPRPERTFDRLAEARNAVGDMVSTGALKKQSSVERWRERLAAYDRFIDARALQSLVDRRVESLTAVADLGKALRAKAAEGIKMLQDAGMRLTVSEIVQLARIGTELEQLALGAPTDRITLQSAAQDATMTDMEAANARSALQSAIVKIRERRSEAQLRSNEDVEALAASGEMEDVDFEVIVEDTEPSPEEIRQERIALNGSKRTILPRKKF